MHSSVDCDGRRGGIGGFSAAVLYHAVELDAVPCGIRGDSFARMRSSVPDIPLGLTGLHIVPLIGQACAFRFDGNGNRLTKCDGLALGLRGDFERSGYGYLNGIGGDGFSAAVFHYAIQLDAVPCGIRGDGFAGMRSATPECEAALTCLLEVPLVAQSCAACGKRKRDGLTQLHCLIGGLLGDLEFL